MHRIARSRARWPRVVVPTLVLGVAVLSAVSSCSGGAAKCATGLSVACTCAGGGAGAQVCGPNGTFGPCVCGGADASPPADATSTDVASDTSLPPVDASQDATDGGQDALVGDGGDGGKDAANIADGGCSSGLACELCNVSGYTPVAQSAPKVMQYACTSQQIQDFTTACVGPNATSTTCNAWQTAQSDAGNCLGCIFTLQTAAAWGPLVCTNVSCSFNTAGCVDLELGQVSQEKQAGGAGSCGDLIDASYGCQDYACGTCTTTSSDFTQCTQSATANECKPYVDAVTNGAPCAALNGDAGPAQCFPQTDTDVPAFVNVFCGTGP